MKRWRPVGSTVVITGASSGIGKQLARQLASRGATVLAIARRGDRLQELSEGIPTGSGSILSLPGDITDERFRGQIIERAESISPQIDLLVNNAGVGGIGPFTDATPERLRRIMEVNFFATVELTRITLPMLLLGKHSVICNISSVLGHRAVPGKSEYCASKFAIHGWSDALRAELAKDNVQVTLVSPSTTASEFFDVAIETKAENRRRRPAMSAERVARLAIRAIERRKDEVVLSAGGKLLVYLDRVCPWLANRIVTISS